MRIALLSWESLHSISIGGVGVHVTELAATLQRKGHEIHVFTRIGEGQMLDESIHGVWYHRCQFCLNSNIIEEINNLCCSIVARFEDIQRISGPFDIVHAHDWLTSNAMVWIKDGFGIQSVLTMHSTEYGRCGNRFYNHKSGLIRDHERHGTYCANRVIAVSKSLKKELCWIYELPDWKVHVIYNGIQTRNFDGFVDQGQIKQRYGLAPFDPMVLFAGRLTTQKGPDLLLQAFSSVLRHHRDARVVFVGEGDMRGDLERQAREMGIHHAFRFVGFKQGAELADLFRACDMVAVPSRNEPFGIVILEAWSAGKPVVATHNGGPSEFVWHNVTGLKVSSDPGSIAWGICELLRNTGHGFWMGQNGRYAAETAFSWDTTAHHTEQVYHSLWS